jgi:hypothetical protein
VTWWGRRQTSPAPPEPEKSHDRSTPAARRLALRAAPGALLLLTGCYTISEDGNSRTYTFAFWVVGLVALVGVAFLAASVLSFRRWNKPLGVLLAIAGVLFAVAIPVMLLLNRVTVDDKHLEVRDIFLWNVEHHSVNFDDVTAANLSVQKTQTRSAGQVTKYNLQLLMKNGPQQIIVVKNALKAAWPDVARQLRARGNRDLPETLPE